MAAVVSVVAVVLISMLINRVATIALSLTGMSREEARFQARAAMSGVGLTTNCPEDIVGHPVRRRIVLWLMIVGSAGIVTGVASVVLSFSAGSAGQRLSRAAVLIGALLTLWLVLRTKLADRLLSRAITSLLCRRGYDARDYGRLLALSGDYAVAELHVREHDWVANRRLGELRLRDEGLVVVGIRRPDAAYVGAAGGETLVVPGDRLIVYGREGRIAELDRRSLGPAGDAGHERAATVPESRRRASQARRARPGALEG